MGNPFSSMELQDVFVPFSPNTPQSEIKIPIAKPYEGKSLSVPNQSSPDVSPIGTIADSLNSSDYGGLTPFVVERNGTEITLKRAESISDERAKMMYGDRKPDADKERRNRDMLKRMGILFDSKLVEDDDDGGFHKN